MRRVGGVRLGDGVGWVGGATGIVERKSSFCYITIARAYTSNFSSFAPFLHDTTSSHFVDHESAKSYYIHEHLL